MDSGVSRDKIGDGNVGLPLRKLGVLMKGRSPWFCDEQRRAPIYHALLTSAVLYELLLKGDAELAAEVHAGRCPWCKGPLHAADYPRKPRGDVGKLPGGYQQRFSLCCGSCRRRVTPPSLRFLGRRVYLGTVVVLLSAMMHGVTPRRASVLRAAVGVPARTVRRWLKWWRDTFVATPTWTVLRGRLLPAPEVSRLPLGLAERVVDPPGESRVEVLMRQLRALTTGSFKVVL
jgi:hypothetical protein